MGQLEEANGRYSTKATSITAEFIRGGTNQDAKRAVTFNCSNEWYIQRDNIGFETIGKTKDRKLIMLATHARWTLFNKAGHKVLETNVMLDHSVGRHLLAGTNLPYWLAN